MTIFYRHDPSTYNNKTIMAFPKTTEVSEEYKARINWLVQPTLNNVKFQQLQNKHLFKFILYWMIFDSYLTEISQCRADEEKLKYFFKEDSDFKKYIADKKISAKSLKELSPVQDMRPNSNRSILLEDENNLEQIIRFLYQIRCNLFHGAKDLKKARENDLVYEGAKYLELSVGGWIIGQ